MKPVQLALIAPLGSFLLSLLQPVVMNVCQENILPALGCHSVRPAPRERSTICIYKRAAFHVVLESTILNLLLQMRHLMFVNCAQLASMPILHLPQCAPTVLPDSGALKLALQVKLFASNVLV
jgi:hypothetical protein